MRHIWVRPTRPEESEQVKGWLARTSDINLVDPSVLGYPATMFWTAEKEGKAILHVPVQPVLMLESLAPSPDCSSLDESLALKQLVQAATWEARRAGMGEIYFLCSDPRVVKFSSSVFTRICGADPTPKNPTPIQLFRLKLEDLP